MLVMAFVFVSDSPGSDASVTPLEEGDIVKIGGEDFYVVHANSTHTNSSLAGHKNIYVIGSVSTTLADNAFRGCTSVEKVYFSGTVSKIGNGAFENMTNLTVVDAPGIKTIGENAFRGSGIESCYFETPLVKIGDNAFRDCDNLKVIDLNATSVTALGDGVFMNSGIECLDLRNIGSIDADAFTGSDLTLQIVTSDQDVSAYGVDRIIFDGSKDFYKSAYCINGRMTFVMDDLEFLEVYDDQGMKVKIDVVEDKENKDFCSRSIPSKVRASCIRLRTARTI